MYRWAQPTARRSWARRSRPRSWRPYCGWGLARSRALERCCSASCTRCWTGGPTRRDSRTPRPSLYIVTYFRPALLKHLQKFSVWWRFKYTECHYSQSSSRTPRPPLSLCYVLAFRTIKTLIHILRVVTTRVVWEYEVSLPLIIPEEVTKGQTTQYNITVK